MTFFAIDPGHCCAYDGGASGINKSENQLIREIAPLVISKLKALGHRVIDVSPRRRPRSLGDSLRQRTSVANYHKVDVFVSLHFNAFDGKAYGSEVLYVSGSGKVIAQKVQNELVHLGYFDRGVKYRSNLHVLNGTNAPAILIEGCFCDSNRDMSSYNAENMANAIVKGLTGQDPVNNASDRCPYCGK